MKKQKEIDTNDRFTVHIMRTGRRGIEIMCGDLELMEVLSCIFDNSSRLSESKDLEKGVILSLTNFKPGLKGMEALRNTLYRKLKKK